MKSKLIFSFLFLIFLCGMYINSTTFFRLKLADHYVKTQNYNKAIITYRKILRKGTLRTKHQTSNIERISDIHFSLANLLFSEGRLTESMQTFKQLAKIDCKYEGVPLPDTLSVPDDYRRLGLLLTGAGLIDMAIEQFQEYTALEPQDSLGYYQLGLLYQRKNKDEAAIRQFKKSLEFIAQPPINSTLTSPDCLSDIYYCLATSLEREEDIEDAIEYYKKTIDLSGNEFAEAYCRLKSLYEKQGNLKKANNIILNLLNLKPEYEVNYKFSNSLILLGYSLNEKEFELFNKGKITFFWKVANQNLGLSYKKEKLSNIYKIGNRLYEVKEIKNLAPNFGFEVDAIGKGFPCGWDTDIYADNPVYYSPVESHQIIFEENPLGKTQCLSLTNALSRCTNCQTDYIAIDENSFYLQAGWIKSINGKAYLGRRWFDSEKRRMKYNYAAAGVRLPIWKYYSQIVIPHSNAAYCRLWVINYKTEGKAYFDDVLFIKLELPELTKKE